MPLLGSVSLTGTLVGPRELLVLQRSHAAQTNLELPLHPGSDPDFLILLPLLPAQGQQTCTLHLVCSTVNIVKIVRKHNAEYLKSLLVRYGLPLLGRQRQEDGHKFKVSLVYIVSSSLTRATQLNSKRQQRKFYFVFLNFVCGAET